MSNGFNASEDTTVTGVSTDIGCETRDEPVDVLMRNSLSGFATIPCDHTQGTHSLTKVAADLHDVKRNVGVGPSGRVPIVLGIGVEELGLISTEPAERGQRGNHENSKTNLGPATLCPMLVIKEEFTVDTSENDDTRRDNER